MTYGASANNSVGTERAPTGIARFFGANPVLDRRDLAVKFAEVVPALEAGGRARRRLWAELDGAVGDWLELVTDGTAGGRPIRPVYMVWNGRAGMLGMWGGAHLEMREGDWEIL